MRVISEMGKRSFASNSSEIYLKSFDLINEDADVRVGGHVHNAVVLLLQAVQLALIQEALEVAENAPSVLTLLLLRLKS